MEMTSGLIIVLIGVDGSGKTTVSREIIKQLEHRHSVACIYFGSGDGKSSWLRRPMKTLLELYSSPQKSGVKPDNNKQLGVTRKKVPAIIRRLAIIPWAISLAIEKRQKLRRALRLKKKGVIVITDRYPQIDVMGYSDGPLLYKKSGVPKRIYDWEYKIYKTPQKSPPDLVIKLIISPETAVRRKPDDITLEEAKKRIAAIHQVRYPGSCEINISAENSLPMVLSEVQKNILNQIQKKVRL